MRVKMCDIAREETGLKSAIAPGRRSGSPREVAATLKNRPNAKLGFSS